MKNIFTVLCRFFCSFFTSFPRPIYVVPAPLFVIPAPFFVIPAQAGILYKLERIKEIKIPACAGMTKKGAKMTERGAGMT